MANKNHNHHPVPMIILSVIIAAALAISVINYLQNKALRQDIRMLDAAMLELQTGQ